MSAEDMRRGKIIKIAVLGFRGELVWNLVRTADILHVDARTRKRQTNELPKYARYRYPMPVITRCHAIREKIFAGNLRILRTLRIPEYKRKLLLIA